MKFTLPSAALFLISLCACQSASVAAVLTDVAYGDGKDKKHTLDIYQPANTPDKLRPAVIYVHGGGWQGGDKSRFTEMGPLLAQEGFVSFAINYRLVSAKGNHWPAQIDDVKSAVRWIRTHAAEYHVDPQRIAALGDSAGGQLVALLGTQDIDEHLSTIVDIYGPVDLTEPFTGKVPKGEWVDGLIATLFDGQHKGPIAKEASPHFHVSAKSAAFLIIHGTADTIVPMDQSVRFDAALRQAGAESKLVILEGEGHGFAGADKPFRKPDNKARYQQEIIQFLKTRLQP